MMIRAALVLAVCMPLPACSTLQQAEGLTRIKVQTRNVCSAAGKAFGWELVDVPAIEGAE
jgi:hypothetical protein